MWQTMTAPFQLRNGAQYACSLNLSWLERHAASDEMIAGKFAAAGFVSVVSDMANSRVTGTWGGADQEAPAGLLPSQVSCVWVWQP